mmetsp:Transcript_10542/g.19047  ORF Transcript_10542/g.19047 Transcript_10542/m.19047 type:complete len:244 (-) Transcript_10542:171-902(-)
MRRRLNDRASVIRIGGLTGGAVHDDGAGADKGLGGVVVEFEHDAARGGLYGAGVGPGGVGDFCLGEGVGGWWGLVGIVVVTVVVITVAIAIIGKVATTAAATTHEKSNIVRTLLLPLLILGLQRILPLSTGIPLESIHGDFVQTVRNTGHGEPSRAGTVVILELEAYVGDVGLGHLGGLDACGEGLFALDGIALGGGEAIDFGKFLLFVFVVLFVVVVLFSSGGSHVGGWIVLGKALEGPALV